MEFSRLGEEDGRIRFRVADGRPGEIVDVLLHDGRRGQNAVGTVHHIAWRVPDDPAELAWQERLSAAGVPVTEVRDRQYFKSIYYREPGGVLYEIATDSPGFIADEAPNDLGTDLKLPPWLEQYRAEIDRALPSIILPDTAPSVA
jgi:glyoxalase family protein